MYQGSCLCGGITFEISGAITEIVYCHCSECRRVQGSAFASNGFVQRDHFKLLSGKELLSQYEYGPGRYKQSCRICAAPIYSHSDAKPDYVRVRLGTISSEIKERPQCHIFVGSKANWYTITDDLPQYEEFPE